MKALNIALASAMALTALACGTQDKPAEKNEQELVKVEVENLPKAIVFKVDEEGNVTTFQSTSDQFNNMTEEDFNALSAEDQDSLVTTLTNTTLAVASDKESVAQNTFALSAEEVELKNSSVNTFGYGFGGGFGYGYGAFGYRTSLYYGGFGGFGYGFGYGYGYGFGYARSAYYIYRPAFAYGVGFGYGYAFGGGFGY